MKRGGLIMNDLFVDYDIALELKKLGFDEPCFCYFIGTKERIFSTIYTENDILPSNSDLILNWVSCPLKYQVFKWFREVHKLNSYICFVGADYPTVDKYFEAYNYVIGEDLGEFIKDTYEETELEVIKQMINIVKNGKNI